MAKRGTKEWIENLKRAKPRRWIKFFCAYCKNESEDKPSHYKRKKRHYCSTACYAKDRKENWKPEEQASWKGGITAYESHRRWVKKNPERMAHLKARRYARQRNAEGSHSFEEWQKLCRENNWRCIKCNKKRKLTKDHIQPLSEKGTDYISNIQPLCRSCNSRKWKFYIYENPELLEPPLGNGAEPIRNISEDDRREKR